MNNNSASGRIRKVVSAELTDVNKCKHTMKKALKATDGEKGCVSFDCSEPEICDIPKPEPKVFRAVSNGVKAESEPAKNSGRIRNFVITHLN